MPTKTCAVQVKATAADDNTLQDGQFTALASVFNNVDAVGDVVMPGAFTDDLKEWAASGDPIPVLWGHQMSDPNMNIGAVLEAKETDVGLEIKAQLDIEHNPNAAQVYRLLKGKRVRKMSFAYDIEDAAPAERDGNSVYELRKLKLHEVSVVQVPANPAAVVQEVKAAAERRRAQLKAIDGDPRVLDLLTQVVSLLGADDPDQTTADESDGSKTAGSSQKAGRTLSAKNEDALRTGIEKIHSGMADVTSVLESLNSIANDGKANPAKPATAEEPPGVKTDSPAFRQGPATSRLCIALDQLAVDDPSHSD